MALGMALAAWLALAQGTPDPAASPPTQDPASTAVRLHEIDTRMTVAVMVNGAGPFRFIVDSAATRTVVSRQLADLLHLPDAGRVALHSVGGESEVDSVRIDALALGDLPARPVVAPVLNGADLGGLGILGIDALAGKRVVIDIAADRMTIEPSERRAPPPVAGEEIVVTARRRYGELVLADADAAGQRIWAIVDTGSMVTIGNIPLQTRLVRHGRARPLPQPITDVTGRRIEAVGAPIHTIRIAGWIVSDVPVAFADAHAFRRFGLADKPAMLFGMDLMRSFGRIIIDFRRRTVRFTRPGGNAPR